MCAEAAMERHGDSAVRSGCVRRQASILAAVLVIASTACGSRPTPRSQEDADLQYAQRWQALEAEVAAGKGAEVDGRTALLVGHRYRELGDVASAEVWYRRSVAASDAPEATVALAALLMARGHYETADSVLREVVASSGTTGNDKDWAASLLRLLHSLRPRKPGKSADNDDVSTERWTNSIGMVFIRIVSPRDHTAGEETARGAGPTRRMPEYWIAKTETTIGQFDEFLKDTGFEAPLFSQWAAGKSGTLPAAYVSWAEARAFTMWLAQRERHVYRLPTEAEWERAASSPEPTGINPWGSSEGEPGVHGAWQRYALGSLLAREPTLQAVGSFPRGDSAAGVSDLAGSVSEWCLDHYVAVRPRQLTDFVGWPLLLGPLPVKAGEIPKIALRGTCWKDTTSTAVVSARRSGDANQSYSCYGFRVVREDVRESG